jgi:hypothetical protein
LGLLQNSKGKVLFEKGKALQNSKVKPLKHEARDSQVPRAQKLKAWALNLSVDSQPSRLFRSRQDACPTKLGFHKILLLNLIPSFFCQSDERIYWRNAIPIML